MSMPKMATDSQLMLAEKGALTEVLLSTAPVCCQKEDWRKAWTGYLCIVLVALTWVAQSEVAQAVEANSYNRPYLITYFNHSLCLLLAPAQGMVLFLLGQTHNPVVQLLSQGSRVIRDIVLISVIYQVADWVWYIGLSSTSVADGTIIFNSMSIFVFLMEWLLGKSRISALKGFAVLLSLLGVVVVEYAPAANSVSTASQAGCLSQTGGNLLVLLAALLYALYQVKIDMSMPCLDAVTTNAFVAIQGLTTLVLLWPGIYLLNQLPAWCFAAEAFQLPQSDAARGVLLSGLLAFAFNVFFCLALVLTSPLKVSVGCMLSVPCSLVADALLHGDSISSSAFFGSGLVIVGFLMITLQGNP